MGASASQPSGQSKPPSAMRLDQGIKGKQPSLPGRPVFRACSSACRNKGCPVLRTVQLTMLAPSSGARVRRVNSSSSSISVSDMLTCCVIFKACTVPCGEGACPRWVAKRPLRLSGISRSLYLRLLRSRTGASPLATKARSHKGLDCQLEIIGGNVPSRAATVRVFLSNIVGTSGSFQVRRV
ncbi:hypothetical protein D3C78_1356880 [compost metagenome]